MRYSDAVAVEIYDDLKKYFFANSQVHGLVGNIIGLFFHDLMVHFTGIVIHRDTQNEYGEEIVFPFVNKEYSKRPFEFVNFKEQEPVDRTLVEKLKRAPLLPFGVGQSIPMSLGKDKFARALLSILGCSHGATAAFLPRRNEQLSFLSETIVELCIKYSIGNHSQVVKNWTTYADRHTTSKQSPLRQRAIILGTRCQIHNRKLAINYLQQEKEVLGMTHGEVSNAVFDEPIFGYADRSYCTTLIDYGGDHGFGKFNRPLIEPTSVLYRTSSIIRKVISDTEDIAPMPLKSAQLLYIPTMYSANKLYGPFRNHEDETYRVWQKYLLNLIPNITVKRHPKSLTAWNHQCKTESRVLLDCINEYDGVLLDYCSTAATISFATDRPIMYFDLGLRNLTAEYREDIKRRCQYIDVSDFPSMNGPECRATLEDMQNIESKKNSQMRKYSIRQDDSEGILPTIYKLLMNP